MTQQLQAELQTARHISKVLLVVVVVLQWSRKSQTQIIVDFAKFACVLQTALLVSSRQAVPTGDLRPSGKHAGRPADVIVCMHVCKQQGERASAGPAAMSC